MARKSLKFSHYSKMLLNLILHSVFWEFAFAFSTRRESRQSESSEKPTSAAPNDQQVCYCLLLHPSLPCQFAHYKLFLISRFAGCKASFRSYCVCCGRYYRCNSSCVLHYSQILLSAEVQYSKLQ